MFKPFLNLKFYTYLIFALCSVVILFSIYTVNIGLDGGFYLSVGRNIWEDHINYYHIASSYNPMGIMILGLPNIFGDVDLKWNLLIYFTILIIDTILFYHICHSLKSDKLQNLFFSSIFLLYTLLLDGHLVVLEPIQLTFLFSTYIFLNRKKYAGVGFFLFLSFLVKQYSLAFLIPILFEINFNSDNLGNKIKNNIRVAIGFLLPLILFYFVYCNSIEFSYFLKRLLGKVPELDGNLTNMKGTGDGYNLQIFLISLVKILFFFPITLFVFRLTNKNEKSKLLIITFISFCVVLIFAGYFHYYQLIVPWVLMHVYHQFEFDKIKHKIALFTILLLPTMYLLVKTVKTKHIISEKEKNTTQLLRKHIPEKSKVFITHVSIAHYALCNFNSIDLQKIGYSFPNILKKEVIFMSLDKGEYLITDDQFIALDWIDRFNMIYKDDDYCIYQRK